MVLKPRHCPIRETLCVDCRNLSRGRRIQASKTWMSVSDAGHEIEELSVDVIGDLLYHLYTLKSIVIARLQSILECRLVIFCFDQVSRRPAPFSSCKRFYDWGWQRSNPETHEHGTRNLSSLADHSHRNPEPFPAARATELLQKFGNSRFSFATSLVGQFSSSTLSFPSVPTTYAMALVQ